MDVSLSVIGLGKLGAPMLAVFAKKGFRVIGMDTNPNFVNAINERLAPVSEPQLQELISANSERLRATLDMREAVLNSDVTFIIVPTPSGEDGFFRNDFIMSALEDIGRALRDKTGYHNVVVTSTVMPGSTGTVLKAALEESSGRKVGEQLGLCYNPEFIALGSVVRDMLYPDLILIGESDRKAGDLLASIYSRSTESNPEVHRMNWVNAELCKISVNTFITTKISYANMIAEMCDHLPDADSDVITNALGADSRIGKKYLKGAVGYGGPCFPRDNKAFAALGRRLGVRTELAEATDSINDHQSKRLFEAIKLSAAPGAKVAILGLTYKPNTPVIEESQGLALAHTLSEAGYRVALSDPVAMASLPAELPRGVERAETADAAMVGAAVVAIVTPWAAYRSLALPREGVQSVVDPWRMIDPAIMRPGVKLIRLGAGDWLAHSDSEVRALRSSR